MASMIVDRQDFDKKIEEAGGKLVIIDFYATWCGPCRLISPKLEELAQRYSEETAIFKVDVDACEDLANEYNVTLMPTFVFMKNKNILDVFVGGNADKLVANLERFVAPQNADGQSPPAIPAAEPVVPDDANPNQNTDINIKDKPTKTAAMINATADANKAINEVTAAPSSVGEQKQEADAVSKDGEQQPDLQEKGASEVDKKDKKKSKSDVKKEAAASAKAEAKIKSSKVETKSSKSDRKTVAKAEK